MRSGRSVAIACIFTWVGFVAAISFMEAWIKFRAPGVTLPIGLGIGRLVFAALNKVEWVLAVVTIWGLSREKGWWSLSWNRYLFAAIAILILQTCWMLPALDVRAGFYLRGELPPHSYLHLSYIVTETLKVIGLLTTGISLLKRAQLT